MSQFYWEYYIYYLQILKATICYITFEKHFVVQLFRMITFCRIFLVFSNFQSTVEALDREIRKIILLKKFYLPIYILFSELDLFSETRRKQTHITVKLIISTLWAEYIIQKKKNKMIYFIRYIVEIEPFPELLIF